MNRDAVQNQEFSPLVLTKVQVPHISRLLSRPRLLDFFHENIQRKLLLVCAGPGYGKTSLLADFARSSDLPVCWYTLDPSDRDPNIFLRYLVEAVRRHFPSFGKRTCALLEAPSPPPLRSIIGTLVNEWVEEIPSYMVIVLDDYHTVEDEPTIRETMDVLLRYLPEHVHLFVASRTVPALPLTRLTAYGQAAALGMPHLRFTPEEGRELFRIVLPEVSLSEEQVREWTEAGEGWVTGLLLQAQATRGGSMAVLTRSDLSREHLYAYLVEEVLEQVPPPVREFAQGAAVLHQVDAALGDALLERDDSAEMLSFLERNNLFVASLEGGWYRFHGLFRDLLLQQMAREPERLASLHRRAAHLWRERGEAEEAVGHLLEAGAWEEAAADLAALAPHLFRQGRFRVLSRYIEALPAPFRQAFPRLLLFLGKSRIVLGQLQAADEALEEAAKAFSQAGNLRGWGQTMADRSLLAQMRGRYQEAIEMAWQALARCQDLPAAVDLCRTLGVCACALGNLSEGEAHLRRAVEQSALLGSPYDHALALLDLGVCLRLQGRMAEAESAYREALGLARQSGNLYLEANILNNLAMGPFLRGDLEVAQEMLLQALEVARRALSPRLQAVVLAGLGDLYRDQGDSAAALRAYQEGLQQAHHADNASLSAYLLEALGDLARRQKEYEQAGRYLQQALELAASSPTDRARVQTSTALLQMERGDHDRAAALLQEAIPPLEAGGGRGQLLRALLVRALLARQQGEPAQAAETLRRAVLLAHETGIREPFLAEAPALLPVLQEAAGQSENGAFRDLVGWLEERPALRPAPTEAVAAPPPLEVLALGEGQVRRDQQVIGPREWGYRLPRELFFYLLFHAPVRKEQIGLALWPDHSPARLNSAFHAALYQVRHAVGAPVVRFQENLYAWDPDLPYRCDVLEFEETLEQAAALAPGEPQRIALLERAVSLYRGDFLADLSSDWCLPRRERLRQRYLEALLTLGGDHLVRREYGPAEEAYRKALQVDSYCEEAYRGLMRACALAGERGRAIQVYRRCRRHLAQELQVEPSEQTVALYRAIRRGAPLPPQPQ